jgi:hypothetical protein
MLFWTAFSHGIHTTIVFQSHSPFWYCISYIFPCAQCLLFKLSAISNCTSKLAVSRQA